MEVDPSALPPRLPTGEIKPARFHFKKGLKLVINLKLVHIKISSDGIQLSY